MYIENGPQDGVREVAFPQNGPKNQTLKDVYIENALKKVLGGIGGIQKKMLKKRSVHLKGNINCGPIFG